MVLSLIYEMSIRHRRVSGLSKISSTGLCRSERRVRRPANHKLVDSLLCLVPVVLAWLVYVLIGVATTRA